MSDFEENNVLTIKTVQISPFRKLITALKDILIETNISFQPDGIRIINMDKSHTIVVQMHLEASKFQEYECKKDKIIIALNMVYFFKLINTMENDDTLTMYINKSDYQDGIVTFLGLKFENSKQCKNLNFKLMEPEQEELVVPDIKFSSIINFPSDDFQKIIRDLSCITNKIEISSIGNQVIIKCKGPFADIEIIRTEDSSDDDTTDDVGMHFISEKNSTKIIQGVFSLKNLGYFTKCTNLCSQIELYLENDLPLVVKYDVPDLGYIKLGTAPLTDE
jgi:proliferating cell nuclear antigen